MVSIRLVAFTAWLLMLNISFVFGVPVRSEIDRGTRRIIKEGIGKLHAKVYDNQYLYFCVVWQHFREYFEDGDFTVLDFLDDLHLTPRSAGVPVDLETLRANLTDWIAEYALDRVHCPDIEEFIEHNVQFYVKLARFMNQNVRKAQYEPIANALKQDYVRYSQEPDTQAKRRLVGKTRRTSPWTVYAILARARFLKTVLRTFEIMLTRQGNQDNDLVAPEQVNPVVAAPVAPAPIAPAPVIPGPVAHAAVPATIQQAQVLNPPPRVPSPRLVPQIVPNPFPRVPSPRLVPQIVPNPPPRVPSPRLVPQIVPNPPPRVPSPRLVPQIVPNPPPRVPSPRLVPQIVPNSRPPYIPSGLDFLAELASRQQPIPHVQRHVQVQQQQDNEPVAGPMRQNRRQNRLEQHDGGLPRRGHDHHHLRNGP